MISPFDTKQTVIITSQYYFDEGYACSHKHHQTICHQLVGEPMGILHELLEQNNQH